MQDTSRLGQGVQLASDRMYAYVCGVRARDVTQVSATSRGLMIVI